ncbi:MAG: hypothetical protein HZA54_06315 [Planctomycetes bacterium]|nr:hypothetical protein [Planctomycetota bacterium]
MRRATTWTAGAWLCAAVWLLPAAAARAQDAAPDAPAKVREGVARFAQGDFDGAGKAFAEADAALPNEPRIAFDRGCAHAAKGETDPALELFRTAARAHDPELALRATFNLGALAAAKARAALGEHPEEAPAEKRTAALDAIANAVGHYRDCLRLGGEAEGADGALVADARHNLELLRLWTKHMSALWAERDRQKRREELDLLAFLEMLRARQVELRGATRAAAPAADSPKRREAVGVIEKAERELAEEIDPLKQKVEQALTGAAGAAGGGGGGPAGPGPDAEKLEQAKQLLLGWADEAGKAMLAAAERLAAQSPGAADAPQTLAIERLDRLFLAVVPFPQLVQRGVETQQGAVDRTAPAAAAKDPALPVELADIREDQDRLVRWSEALPFKAKEGQKLAESMPDPPPAPAPSPAPGPGPAPAGSDPETMKKQKEALQAACAKALEVAPQLRADSLAAAEFLKAKQAAAALPKEESALALWKAIADLLPKQEDGKDGKEGKEAQQEKEQPPGSEKQPEKPPEGGQQPPKPPRDASKEQAEALLRKAQERERQHQEQEKQLQAAILQAQPVEKDW